jgi:hypothetical protein
MKGLVSELVDFEAIHPDEQEDLIFFSLAQN